MFEQALEELAEAGQEADEALETQEEQLIYCLSTPAQPLVALQGTL